MHFSPGEFYLFISLEHFVMAKQVRNRGKLKTTFKRNVKTDVIKYGFKKWPSSRWK